MWVRGLGWERIPRGLRRRSNRGDSFSPPSVLAAEMMSACGKPPLKTPKNQFPAVSSDRPIIRVSLLDVDGAGAAAPDVRPRCHGVPVLCGTQSVALYVS